MLEAEVEKLCSEVKKGQENGSVSYKEAIRRITDMGDVRNYHTRYRPCVISLSLSHSLSQELSSAMISQWRKEAMRTTLKTFKKSVIDADRAAKAKLVQKVTQLDYAHNHCL